jgi:hypothetical protein
MAKVLGDEEIPDDAARSGEREGTPKNCAAKPRRRVPGY